MNFGVDSTCNGSTWHNLVGFKNHKKWPSTVHSDFDQNIFFVDLNTCGLM